MERKCVKADLRPAVCLTVLLSVLFLPCLFAGQAYAASAKVQFSTESQEVKAGDVFHIVCTVSSEEKFHDVKMTLFYDAGVFEFIRGGGRVSGGNGVLDIASTGNENSVRKRTFSIEFRALKPGSGSFAPDGKVEVTNEEGEGYSVSANLLTVKVAGDSSAEPSSEQQEPDQSPGPTPEAVLNTNNKLKKLSFNGISMSPDFDPDVLEYTVKVDCNTNVLYFNYEPGNGKARVRIKNSEELIAGENNVKVVVTAESGDKRTYKVTVVKETEDQTKIREQLAKGSSDITFSVYEEKGAIYIQNQYQFQVVDVKDDDVIPSGYVKTNVELEGKSVPAYTMENDLENNYLLMYLKGVGGEPTLYQYDRAEKTLQRYTGTMVQKVNQGGNVASQVEIVPNAWLYAAIVSLLVIVLALLIIILNMVLRKKIGRGKRELDDLDF